jgi:hypothetical protein
MLASYLRKYKTWNLHCEVVVEIHETRAKNIPTMYVSHVSKQFIHGIFFKLNEPLN